MLPVLAAIGAGVGIASSIWGANSAYNAAKKEAERLRLQYEAQRKKHLYDAQVTDFNRGVIEQNRRNLIKQEGAHLQQIGEKGFETIVAQNRAAAANGISLVSGSMSEIRKTTMYQNSIEAAAIRESYSAGRFNFDVQAIGLQRQAEMSRRASGTYSNVDLSVSASPYIAQAMAGIGSNLMNLGVRL